MPSGVFPDSISSSNDVDTVDDTEVSIIGNIIKKIATKAER